MVGERGQKLSGVSGSGCPSPGPSSGTPRSSSSRGDELCGHETEAAIQRSLETVSRNRTTVAIAHRLSTIRNADRIHVLERGEVREAGTHDQLVGAGGLYTALWRVQTGEAAEVR